ncbi:hypothetical protein CMUS01_00895 [Colletotrichum musicola]|uniref:Uncharacterized protein n=1 Tax=Colletotrichum musicola TaxID=2175873 RepID=A0A8H6U967_9PEZI|nr:hypothetical protein CMUS01_00895 [Colletotrichum musicola]
MTSTYLRSPRFRLEGGTTSPLAAAPSKLQPIGSGAYLPTVDVAGQSRHPDWRKGNLELTPVVDDIVEFPEFLINRGLGQTPSKLRSRHRRFSSSIVVFVRPDPYDETTVLWSCAGGPIPTSSITRQGTDWELEQASVRPATDLRLSHGNYAITIPRADIRLIKKQAVTAADGNNASALRVDTHKEAAASWLLASSGNSILCPALGRGDQQLAQTRQAAGHSIMRRRLRGEPAAAPITNVATFDFAAVGHTPRKALSRRQLSIKAPIRRLGGGIARVSSLELVSSGYSPRLATLLAVETHLLVNEAGWNPVSGDLQLHQMSPFAPSYSSRLRDILPPTPRFPQVLDLALKERHLKFPFRKLGEPCGARCSSNQLTLSQPMRDV